MASLVDVQKRPNRLTFRPIVRTSATLNEVLRTCSLKAAFQNDPQFSKIRSLSTAAALGTVSHRLLEASTKGEFDSTKDDALGPNVRQRWDKLVGAEYQKLQGRAIGCVPIPVRWPKYAIRKAAACIAASRVAQQRANLPHGALPPNKEVTSVQAEAWYEGYGGKLGGSVDLVRDTDAGIELVDYKSGPVIDKDATGKGDHRIRGHYRRQVLIYAALVHENKGRWPVKATLDSLVDGPIPVVVTPKKANDVVDEALELLGTYNQNATAGTVRGQPGEDACQWCDFKALCNDFLQTAEASWDMSNVTITGQLIDVHPGPPSYISLDITGGNHKNGQSTIRGIPVRFTTSLLGLQGGTLSFAGLRNERDTDDLLFDWSSQCWLSPDPKLAN